MAISTSRNRINLIGNPASNLELLNRTFGHAIQSMLETDSTGLKSSVNAQRAPLTFIDNSRLYITEKLRQGKIVEFQYDWVNPVKEVLAKFHGEPHDDEDFQTATEPYHAHPPEYNLTCLSSL